LGGFGIWGQNTSAETTRKHIPVGTIVTENAKDTLFSRVRMFFPTCSCKLMFVGMDFYMGNSVCMSSIN
jgi:hypothetical protein